MYNESLQTFKKEYNMGRKYTIKDNQKPYFVTMTVVGWVDVFTRDEYKNIFLESLKFCINAKGLEVHAYCIMTNHIHLIISTNKNPLSEIIRDLKKFTSRKITEAVINNASESRKGWMLWVFKSAGEYNANNENYQFWIQDNHPIELNNIEIMMQKLTYIHQNPVKAGFVSEANDWLWSSAGDYSDRPNGLLDISFLY
jgi:REP element-mobilizing transposase RayT